MANSRTNYDIIVGHYRFDLMNEFARGSYGTLYKGVGTIDNSPVVAKKMNYKTTEGEKIMKMAKNELDIFRKLSNHKNIVHLLHHEDDGKNHWFILEFCDLGHLEQYMKNKTLNMTSKIKIMCDCACAISFMHSFTPPLVHRDIKPENVLMKSENGKDIVKVTDFGLGKNYEELKKGLTMKTFAGSLYYMAPELFAAVDAERRYQPSVDTFSLGLLFYVVLCHDGSEKELRPMSGSNKYSTIEKL